MKKVLFAFLTLFSLSTYSQVCNVTGDLMIFTNYDGGTLTINVDQNISNIKIGVCSYEAIRIVLTGAFVGNVVAVRYAGYNGTNNTGCGTSIPTTTIIGAPGTAVTSTVFAPTATLSNSFGYGSIICGYSCSNNSNQGGCNTVDQIEAYFLGYFSGSTLFAHKVQYNCWTGTQSVSAGGSCCPPVTVIAGGVSASQTICAGQTPAPFSSTLAASSGTSVVTYTWQSSTVSGSSGFTNISGANAAIYSAGVLSQTTWYRRAASTASNNTVYSNVLAVTVNPLPVVTINGPSGLCPSSTITLTAQGANSYTWLPSGTNSNTITLSSAATVTLLGSSLSCSNAVTKSITAFPAPVVNANGSNTVCLGKSVTYVASGAATYSWIPLSLQGANVSFTPVTSSSNNYTLMGTDINGCIASTQFTIGILPLPFIAAIASNLQPCEGDTILMTATGANTFTWQPGNLTGVTVTVNPPTNTIFTITGTNANGCENLSLLSLVFNPLPQISLSVATQPVCSGKTAVLSASGATSFTWQPGNLIGTSINIIPGQNTTYTVTGFDGCYNQSTLSLVVVPSPTVVVSASKTSICSGENSKLTASGANNYVWTTPSNSSSNPNISVTPSVTTVYTVVGSVGNGCDTKAVFSLSVSACTNLTQYNQDNNGWRVFPNPAYDFVTFHSDEDTQILIFNSLGKMQSVFELNDLNGHTREIKMLEPGIYFVTSSNNSAPIYKLVVLQQ